MHPKMGSTLESRGRVRVAGKPSDEPLRKGETKSPDVKVVTVLTQSLIWIGFRCFRFVLGSFQSPILFSVVFQRYCVTFISTTHPQSDIRSAGIGTRGYRLALLVLTRQRQPLATSSPQPIIFESFIESQYPNTEKHPWLSDNCGSQYIFWPTSSLDPFVPTVYGTQNT